MKRAWIPAWAFWLMLLLPLCAGLAEATDGEAAYYGTIGKRMTVYREASESAASLGKIEAGTVVDVYKKGRTWTRIGYENGQGYVLTKFVEMVQRKNPFDGPMPGTSKHVAVGYVLTDTLFTPEGYRYPISVSAGSWISIHRIKDGRAYFPYRRLEDDVSLGVDKLRMYDFVDWSEAKPGDLLYAFTTFYSTSTSKEGNVGRVYNIALASERLTGIRVKAGESFSFNAVCGPYTKENGYMAAPILSGESKMGYGGGVCQVSTALYRLALLGGLEVAERSAAVYPVPYCEAGQEAAVSDQGLDLVFVNNTQTPLFLTARVYGTDDGQTMEVQLIGQPTDGRFALESEIETIDAPDEPVYVRDSEGRYATYTDERIPVGEAMPGYRATVKRINESTGQTEITSEDTYDAAAQIVYVGVQRRD